MPSIRRLALLWACSYFLAWAGSIPPSEYKARRAQLRGKLDGTLILFGRTEGRDEVFTAPQDSDFFYLTGWTEPNAVLLMTPKSEVLFLPHRNDRIAHYLGPRADAADPDVCARTGFDHVAPIEKFESTLLLEAIGSGEKVYSKIGTPAGKKLEQLLALREIAPAGPIIAPLRMKKSAAEIAAIRHSTEVSMEAHRAAWKRLSGGTYEYQAVATFTSTLLEDGCEGHAYSPIFGSGPNGTILHYSANQRRMDAGEVIVIDAAAECGGYTTDITRTLPVSGKFTSRQREVYELVLAAQKAVIATIKPGVDITTLTKTAREYFNKHKDAEGKPLGEHLWHGVSHHVGLDVHDANVPGTLEAGMVITVEPGLYFPKESLGVRIEDTILVTEKGAEILSGALPREPDEVEKAMAR